MSDRLETREQLVERLVDRVRRAKLTVPALALLDLIQPFAFLAGQGLYLCQPVLGYLVDGPRVGALAELLSDPDSVRQLVAQLEHTAGAGHKDGVEGA